MRPDRDIEGARAAHVRLIASLDGLTDGQILLPSLLPGWTVGHVLTHLARNADSHIRLLEAAAHGEVVDQYPPGAREVDIEAGSARSAAELVADVRTASALLETTWSATPPGAWATGVGRCASGEVPVSDLPFRRWREVEVHRSDLGFGSGADDWSEAYIDLELDRAVAEVGSRLRSGEGFTLEATDTGRRWMVASAGPGARVVAADRRRLLAWLIGRLDEPIFPRLDPW